MLANRLINKIKSMLKELVQYLKTENPSLDVEGLSLQEQYRALVNVRPALPIAADILAFSNPLPFWTVSSPISWYRYSYPYQYP